jgi:hypothetical protein
MFKPKLAAERKVSFERDDLTRQRLVTFLREEMCAAVLQGMEAQGQKREDCRSVIGRCFECLQIK